MIAGSVYGVAVVAVVVLVVFGIGIGMEVVVVVGFFVPSVLIELGVNKKALLSLSILVALLLLLESSLVGSSSGISISS